MGFLNRLLARKPVTQTQTVPSRSIRGPRDVFFGGGHLPADEATKHFLAVGTTGSGKTIVLRLLMQSALPDIGTGNDTRAIIYDAKQDMMSILASIVDPGLICTTNPFDQRGASWCLWQDVSEPRVAVEIAFTLIPREHESQPFFSDAARHLTYGVMTSFMLSGREWEFADLVRTLRSQRILKQVLRQHDYTREIIHLYFRDKRLLSNIMSTIATKMLPFEPIAAAWESAEQRFAMEDWIQQEQALILGNSETSRAAIDAINRCIFKRACDLTLSLPESFTRSNWFIVDEVSEAGKHDSLVSLLKKGRSKGAKVVLATQSISGLRDQKMYGPHFTDEILGQIGNRFIGRLECPETAEWLSRLIGDQEVVQINRGSSSTSGKEHSSSSSVNRSTAVRRAVLPAELMSIPGANSSRGISGYYLLREGGCYFTTISGNRVFGDWLEPANPNVPDFIPRDVHSQYLQPWTDERAAAFGLDLTPPVRRDQRNEKEVLQEQREPLSPVTGDPGVYDELFQ
ncbi:MAG: hypothetical protein RLZZ536_504 [Planctomycetota bacterium]